MRKILSLSALSVIFFAGCSFEIPEPEKKIVIQKPIKVEKKVAITSKCDCPKPEVEEKKEVASPKCPYETKVIRYINNCSGSCGFPVSTRKSTTCKEGKK
jgi:hypothetical protein